MRSTDVIAAHALLPNESEAECNCRRVFYDDAEWAEHVEAELAAAGIAVVELPRPDAVSGEWVTGPSRTVWVEDRSVVDEYWVYLPVEAEAYALGLLAAARQAGGGID